MKRTMTILGLTVLFLALFGVQGFGQKLANRYLVKSAIVKMKHSGMSEGEETIYIDQYGERVARYTDLKTSVMGMTSRTKELELTLGDEIYSIDLLTNTGVKSTIPVSDMSEKEMKEWAAIGEQMLEDMGFEKTGQEKILGKTCDVWEGMGTRSWIWNNLALKTEISMMGKATIEAIDLQVDVAIPASKFKVPDGISFEEAAVSDEEVSEESMEELQESLKQLKGILGTGKKK